MTKSGQVAQDRFKLQGNTMHAHAGRILFYNVVLNIMLVRAAFSPDTN